MTMMNSQTTAVSVSTLEYGALRTGWTNEHTLTQLVQAAFPDLDKLTLDDGVSDGAEQLIRSTLTARRLSKRSGLTFEPTDDLRNHLRLDRKLGTVHIFHHVAFLKEHLRLTKGQSKPSTVSEQLKK